MKLYVVRALSESPWQPYLKRRGFLKDTLVGTQCSFFCVSRCILSFKRLLTPQDEQPQFCCGTDEASSKIPVKAVFFSADSWFTWPDVPRCLASADRWNCSVFFAPRSHVYFKSQAIGFRGAREIYCTAFYCQETTLKCFTAFFLFSAGKKYSHSSWLVLLLTNSFSSFWVDLRVLGIESVQVIPSLILLLSRVRHYCTAATAGWRLFTWLQDAIVDKQTVFARKCFDKVSWNLMS